MPEPVRSGQRYLPGLDGLRAIAVLAVIAYHVQIGWAPGGLLGVGVFFTLSGYLITDLLLGQWDAASSLRLGDFWLRRARRLLPAMFVMMAVVAGWTAVADRARLPGLRGAVAASAGYVSNWWLIASRHSYFAQFGPPSPLGHLWSLAVEEQFYLLWPWLLWLGLRFLPGLRGLRGRRGLAAATLALAVASAVAMAVLYQPGYDPTRVYDGTDTRAAGLLIGAALAMLWPSRPARTRTAGARWLLDGAGAAGLAVIAWMIWRTGEYSAFLYRGGLVVLSVATAGVVAAAACPGSRLGQVLGCPPLRWLGVRSYGIYLWHYPVIVLTTPADGSEDITRAVLQVAASVGLAAVSWKYVEEPVRRGALGRLWASLRAAHWRAWAARPRWPALAGALAVLAVACVGCVGLSGVVSPPAAGHGAMAAARLGSGPARRPPAAAGRAAARAAGPAGGPLRSSCRAVVHIGDSTSEGMVSRDYLPRRKQRLRAQYARVGVTEQRMEISGARSVVETYEGQPNAYQVAQQLLRAGYRGCWVLALGTNDTANVAVGSPIGLQDRIQRMMSLIGGQPVLWVNVKSLLASGPYAEQNMQAWDQALVRACARYPGMRVFDWASAAKDRWFISDGVHYTSAGYAHRGRRIAAALARAFPASPASPAPPGQASPPAPAGCLVS